jgi:uncharacterized protein YbjT (DUF2867 family)
MATPLRSILVTGATGKQGGALARSLLSKGHHVRALARNPDSPPAEKLRERGAEIISGNMEDPVSMAGATGGVDAIFVVTTPFESGVESEVCQGITVADAAKSASVPYLVYTSAPQADTRTGILYFESKTAIESHIKSLGVPYTILAPSFFMENLSGPYHMPGLHEGRFAIPLSPTCKLQMISAEDIASFATLMLEQQQPFLGRRIGLASDELTPPQIAQVLSHAVGRNSGHYRTPMQEIRAWSKDLGLVYERLDRIGTSIDIGSLCRDYPEIGWRRLQPWAEAQSWGLLTHERVEKIA